MTEPQPQLDPRKVRIGLIMISLVVIAALVLLVFVVEDPFGRAVMFAVVALGVVRAFLLTRSLRR